MPIGVVLRRTPGTTRWAKWAWGAVAVTPGGGPGHWTELRREGDAVEFHAATVPLELHRSETEGYLVALNGAPPSVYVIMRRAGGPDDRPEIVAVTASAYEAQDHTDNGEDIVERVRMPEGLEAWIGDFCTRHHVDEAFVKRKRRPHLDAQTEDGKGDARIRQAADVFRSPGSIRGGRS
ncbi:DUF3305 domain-containing protein [Rhodovulum iodosum]|nr:DUF3305 domain-containing protein [Rhodovulum robiginosum]